MLSMRTHSIVHVTAKMEYQSLKEMHPDIPNCVTATLYAARYRKRHSQPLKNAPLTSGNHSENVGNINTERPLEKQV